MATPRRHARVHAAAGISAYDGNVGRSFDAVEDSHPGPWRALVQGSATYSSCCPTPRPTEDAQARSTVQPHGQNDEGQERATMTLRPCVVCGEPTTRGRCPQHRGYDAAWDRLSRKARRLQPFCSDCGAVEDLQTDHTPEAWTRKVAGKTIRLQDVDVVCGPSTAPAAPPAPTR